MSNKWKCLISWIVGQIGRQTSCMDLSFRHQKKDPSVALDTPSMTLKIHENGEWFQNKEYSLEYQLFVETYFHIMYIYINRISRAQVHELPQSHCGDNLEGTLFSWLHPSQHRRLQDVLKRSGRLEKDVGFTMSWRRLIYVVLKTSNLRRLEDVWFMTSSGSLVYNVLKTSDLRRLEGVQFVTSWKRLIYVFRTSDLRRLEDVQLTLSWRRPLRRLEDVWFMTSWRRL